MSYPPDPSSSSSFDKIKIEENFNLLNASKVCESVFNRISELPLGFKFVPEDDELLVFYLANKILDRPLPFNVIQQKDNLYNLDPDQLNIG